jgi:hypothetical protein
MHRNAGTFDRTARIVAGVALIGLAITNVIGMWGYIGVIPLLTGAIGNCPIYSIFGIDTCAVKR